MCRRKLLYVPTLCRSAPPFGLTSVPFETRHSLAAGLLILQPARSRSLNRRVGLPSTSPCAPPSDETPLSAGARSPFHVQVSPAAPVTPPTHPPPLPNP